MLQQYVYAKIIANIVKNVSSKKTKITTFSTKRLTKFILFKRPWCSLKRVDYVFYNI